MSIINMLRGGHANGGSGTPVYTHNMYPRPDMVLDDMAQYVGWENSKSAFHLVHRFDACKCHDAGALLRAKKADATTDACGLEVGDEIPLVWIPNRATIEAVTLEVVSGIAGVTVGVRRYEVTDGNMVIADATAVADHLAGSDAGPLPSTAVTQADIDALSCDDRLDLDRFCQQCASDGCYYQDWLATPALVGGCEPAGQYLSLVIEELPDDFECGSCCLQIDVGAQVRIPRTGD